MEVHEFSAIDEPGVNVSELVVDFHSEEYPDLSSIEGIVIDCSYSTVFDVDPNVIVR